MEIKVIGNKTEFLKGKKENVLINPTKEILANGKYSARIVLLTNKEEMVENKTDGVVIIQGPGEYEIGGVEVVGYKADGKNNFFVVGIDGLVVGVLGELEGELNEKRVEKIEGVDVLLAPTLIKDQVSAKVVLGWAKKWGVNYLIPVGDEPDLDKFLDVADEEGLEKIESLKIEKADLPDGLEIKVLKKV